MTTTHHERNAVRTARPTARRRSQTTTTRRSHGDAGNATASRRGKRPAAKGSKAGAKVPRVPRATRSGDNAVTKVHGGERLRAFGTFVRAGLTGGSGSGPARAAARGRGVAAAGDERQEGHAGIVSEAAEEKVTVAAPKSADQAGDVTGGNSSLITHQSAEAADSGPTSGARAREQVQSNAAAKVTARSRLVKAVGKGLASPDIVRQPRPSLQQLWTYAKEAPYAPETGVRRRLTQAFSLFVAMPAHAAAYVLLQVVERPTRLFVAWLLALVLILAGPGAWVLAVGIDAAEWVLDLLEHLTGRG